MWIDIINHDYNDSAIIHLINTENIEEMYIEKCEGKYYLHYLCKRYNLKERFENEGFALKAMFDLKKILNNPLCIENSKK